MNTFALPGRSRLPAAVSRARERAGLGRGRAEVGALRAATPGWKILILLYVTGGLPQSPVNTVCRLPNSRVLAAPPAQ